VIGNWIRGGVGECEEVYGRESDFYMYKFCHQMCPPCDKHGEIAAKATTHPDGDRLSGDRWRALVHDHMA